MAYPAAPAPPTPVSDDLPGFLDWTSGWAAPWIWLSDNPSWSRLVRALLLAWLALLTLFGQIDAQLGQMHLSGAPSFTTADLNPWVGPVGLSHLQQILGTWGTWQLAHPLQNGPGDLIRAHLAFDLIFPLLTAALLGLLAGRIWSRATPGSVERQISAVAVIAPLLYLATDYAENAAMGWAAFDVPPSQVRLNLAALVVVVTLLVLLVLPTTGSLQPTWKKVVLGLEVPAGLAFGFLGHGLVTPASCGGGSGPCVQPVHEWNAWLLVVSNLKWLLVLVMVVALLVAMVEKIGTWLSLGGVRRWLRGTLGTRGQLVAILPLLLLPLLPKLSADLGLQVQDVVVRTLADGQGWGRWVQPLAFVVVPVLLMLVLASFGSLGIEVDEEGDPPPLPGAPPAPDPPVPSLCPWLVRLSLGLLLIALGLAWKDGRPFLVASGAVVLVISFLSLPDKVRAKKSTLAVLPPGNVSPAVLSAVVVTVPFALALLGIRATFTLWQAGQTANIRLPVVATVLVLATAVAAAAYPGVIRWLVKDARRTPVLIVATAAAIGVTFWAELAPVSFGEAAGSLFVLLTGCGVLAVLFGWLVIGSGQVTARGALALVRFRRLPALTLMVVVALMASSLDGGSRYHDVNTIKATDSAAPAAGAAIAARSGLPVTDAFDSWVKQVPLTPGAASTDLSQRSPIPMVFVSTAGGGIKAAYWTSVVLGCLTDKATTDRDRSDLTERCPAGQTIPRQNLFAVSGISGGSVGLAMDQARHDAAGNTRFGLDAMLGTALGEDGVGPAVTGMFWRDAPNTLVRFGRWPDRATLLEQSWTRSFDRAAGPGSSAIGALSAGLWATSGPATSPRFPMLLLNGASIDDHCRIAGSVLDLAPDTTTNSASCNSIDATAVQPPTGSPDRVLSRTRDLGEYVCSDHDVSLATAGLLSARFPLVSPFGILRPCSVAAGTPSESQAAIAGSPLPTATKAPAPRAFDVDGGLVESSGAGPLPELLQALSAKITDYDANHDTTCIAPRLLMIDNNYELSVQATDPSTPNGLASPQGFRAADSAASAAAQQAATLAFERAFPDHGCGDQQQRVAKINLQGHPGLRAPLGWSLSNETSHEMLEQIKQTPARCGLVAVRSWFSRPDGSSATDDACLESTTPVRIVGDHVESVSGGAQADTQVYWEWTATDASGSGFYELKLPVVDAEGHVQLATRPNGRHPVLVCVQPTADGGTSRLGEPVASKDLAFPGPTESTDAASSYLAIPLTAVQHRFVDLAEFGVHPCRRG
jgi:hypothetical protein